MLQEDLTCFQKEFWESYFVRGTTFPGMYTQEYFLLESGDSTFESYKPAIVAYASQAPGTIEEGDTITRISDGATFTVAYNPAVNGIGRLLIPVQL